MTKNINHTTIMVRKTTKAVLDSIRDAKGYRSVDELIVALLKATNTWSKGQIQVIGELEVKTAPSEEMMYRAIFGEEAKRWKKVGESKVE